MNRANPRNHSRPRPRHDFNTTPGTKGRRRAARRRTPYCHRSRTHKSVTGRLPNRRPHSSKIRGGRSHNCPDQGTNSHGGRRDRYRVRGAATSRYRPRNKTLNELSRLPRHLNNNQMRPVKRRYSHKRGRRQSRLRRRRQVKRH